MSSSYFVLALKGKIGWWLAILVLGRDVLLLVACAVISADRGLPAVSAEHLGEADHVL